MQGQVAGIVANVDLCGSTGLREFYNNVGRYNNLVFYAISKQMLSLEPTQTARVFISWETITRALEHVSHFCLKFVKSHLNFELVLK